MSSTSESVGKRVVLLGASGMVGKLILELAVSSPKVLQVTSIVRKSGGFKDPKLKEVVHSNFLDFSAIESELVDQDVCFFCIGVYTGQVKADEFRKITVGFTEAFARSLRANSQKTSFVFLSGQGADSSEKSGILFAKEKGRAENILLSLNFNQTFLARPGYIYPTTPRREPNFSYVVFKYAYAWLLRFVYPNIGITSTELARAMFRAGMSGAPKTILENKDLRALAGT